MEYEANIGLEIHAELKTEAKLFCGCSTKFGAPPNTQTCPVCLGLPGVLPVLNQKALEYTIMVGLALDCQVSKSSKFDRKNYFYPDLPKNYQISQYDNPLCFEGGLDIFYDGKSKRIGIIRVHLEEEAGKLIHFDDGESGVDFNRTGIPLLEIVSKPEINSPEEAYHYIVTLKSVLEYLDVSDCNMEEGSFRCDTNISVRLKGQTEYGTKAEIKNLNSINGVRRALAYEIERQVGLLRKGERIVLETRRWDPDSEKTISMRSKEEAHDYRYFPEPDLVPVSFDEEWIQSIQKGIPELPNKKKKRFMTQYGLNEYDASVMTSQKPFADYYEKCAALHADYKAICNWMMGDFTRRLNEEKIGVDESRVTPEMLADMLKLVDDGKISGKIAKTVFDEMFNTGKKPAAIIKERSLVQLTDEKAIEAAVIEVMKNHPQSVKDYKAGRERAFGFIVGQVMKATKGKANPQLVNKILKEKLKN